MKNQIRLFAVLSWTLLACLKCMAQVDADYNSYNGIYSVGGTPAQSTTRNTEVLTPAKLHSLLTPLTGLPCHANTFFVVANAQAVEELEINGNTVTSNGVVLTDSGYRSLAYCDNLNGGSFSPTFYGASPHSVLDYYNGSATVLTGASTLGASGIGGHNGFLYFSYSDSIMRYDGTSLSTIYRFNGSRIYAADLAVDDNGNAWTVTGPFPLTGIANSIQVISPAGVLIRQYSISLNTNNAYGIFLLNGILYIGFGGSNPVYPFSLLPISFTGNTAVVGTPLAMGTQYSFDLASCNPGDPLAVGCTLAVNLGADTTACFNDTITLDAGNAGSTYSWYLNNAIITGAVNQTYQPQVSGMYSVVVTHDTCVATDSIQVTIENPVVTISSSQTIGCADHTIYLGYGPQSITLTANATGAVRFLWSTGDTTQSITVDSAGIYTVTVWNSAGCASIQTPQSQLEIKVADIRCGHNLKKLLLCHVPPGNTSRPHAICIASQAVTAHLSNHPGDCLGLCGGQVSMRTMNAGTEQEETGQVFLFPNPFSDSFTLQEENEFDVPVELIIHDLAGKVLERYSAVTGETPVGENLPNGVYLVEVISGQDVQMIRAIKLK